VAEVTETLAADSSKSVLVLLGAWHCRALSFIYSENKAPRQQADGSSRSVLEQE
jgi:hypothetical protein